MRRLAIALLLGTAIPALGQQAAPQFVARVNGVAITQSAFDRALRGVLALGMRDSPELRATVRDQVIARELFRQEAEKSEIQTDPELRAAEEEARTNAMLQSWLRSAIKPRRVTEAEVRRRYDAVVASLGEREYKARLIQVSSEAVARALAAQLKANAASFESLARQFSTAPSAVSGGALEWLSFK